MIRRFIIALVLVLLAVPVVGNVAAQEEEPIRIGILADLSGWLSVYGVEQVNGFQLGLLYQAGIDPLEYDSIEEALAEVRVGGRPVELIVRDYGSENAANDADNAATLARELIESDFVDVIFGTPNSGAAIQVQELTRPENYDLIFLAGPAASPSITGPNFNINTFRVCRNTDQDALTFATVANQFGTRYVQIAVETDFGRGTAAAFQNSLEPRGIEFVRDTIFAPSDTVDFTPYLQQALDSGADTLNPIMAGQAGLVFNQQVLELGILDRMNVVGGTNSNDFIVGSPPIPDAVAYIVYNYTLPETEINDLMTAQHIALFNDVPDLFTECSFASAQALYLALEATGGDPFPEAVIPAMEGLSFEGPKGEYYIRRSDHQVLVPLYVIQFRGIEQVEIAEGLTVPLPNYELIAEVSGEETSPPCNLPEALQERCSLDDDR